MVIKFQVHEDPKRISLLVPALNSGRFRFKQRSDAFKFGKSFAATSSHFCDSVYLEWQIGYDAVLSDVTSGNKHTSLAHVNFFGANKKAKHPYELSELLHAAIRLKLINGPAVGALSAEIAEMKDFLDREPITVDVPQPVNLNGTDFQKTVTALPTFFLPLPYNNAQIEVSIQKQQYASGVQPMLYLCLPFASFANASSYRGRCAVSGERLEYVITIENVGMLLQLFRVFAMCLPAHNHDVQQIVSAIAADPL